jgi:hypothetical protein
VIILELPTTNTRNLVKIILVTTNTRILELPLPISLKNSKSIKKKGIELSQV